MLSTHLQPNRDYLEKSGNPAANDSVEVHDDLGGGGVIRSDRREILRSPDLGENRSKR